MFAELLTERAIATTPGRDAKPWVIAHRGYSGAAPENTLAAVDAARAIGCDLVEVDVNLSADGTPVVIHDPTLNRTTNEQGAVGLLSDERISLADAGSWLGPGFAGQRVVPLETLLADLSQFGGELLLELKQDWSPAAISRVAQLIIAAGMGDRTILQSFSPLTLEAARDVIPMVPRCLLRMVPKDEDLALANQLEAIAVNPSLRGFHLRRDFVAEVMRAGLGVFVWTADRASDWEKLLASEVNAIITNQPGRLQGYLVAKYDTV